MKELLVVEAVHIGGGFNRDYRDLILLYNDGTWEKVFRYDMSRMDNRKCINITNFRGKTKTLVIDKLKEHYYNDTIRGTF